MKKSTKLGIIVFGSIFVGLFPEVVLAQGGGYHGAGYCGKNSIGGMARIMLSNFDELTQMMMAGGYLGGVGFGINAALKFKEHAVNPQQVKLSQPLSSAAVAGALLSLGTWLDVLASSENGQGRDADLSQKMEHAQNDPCAT